MAINFEIMGRLSPIDRELLQASMEGDSERVDEILNLKDQDTDTGRPPTPTANINARGDQGPLAFCAGYTPLMWTAYYGDVDLANNLLEKGAELEIESAEGHTALKVAILRANIPMIDLLIEKGANVNAADNTFGITPLHLLVRHHGQDETAVLEIADKLLYAGANYHQKDLNGLEFHQFAPHQLRKQLLERDALGILATTLEILRLDDAYELALGS